MATKLHSATKRAGALRPSLGVEGSASGAAHFQVAVVAGGLVDGGLALQRRLIFARGGPVGGFAAVLDAVEEVDGETWWEAEKEEKVTQTFRRCVALDVSTV